MLALLLASGLHDAFRMEALRGDPAAAAALYSESLAEPAAPCAGAVGLGRCLERLGRDREAAGAYAWALEQEGASETDAAAAVAGVCRTAPELLESFETAPGRWLLPRSEVGAAIEGAFGILGQIKVEPYLEKGGQVGGLLLRSVEEGSLPARRGFRPYDIVRRIQGRPVTSSGADEILSLLASLRNEPVVEVELERLGGRATLRYEILDDRALLRRRGPFPKPAWRLSPP